MKLRWQRMTLSTFLGVRAGGALGAEGIPWRAASVLDFLGGFAGPISERTADDGNSGAAVAGAGGGTACPQAAFADVKIWKIWKVSSKLAIFFCRGLENDVILSEWDYGIGWALTTNLTSFLDEVFEQYHVKEHLVSDPLEFVHRYTDPWDRECVAVLGALLAYGNVKQIRASVQDALKRMESAAGGPARFVRELHTQGISWGTPPFRGWVHRFNIGLDLLELFLLLGRSWNQYGSLGAHFLQGLEPAAPTIEVALDRLMSDWAGWRKEIRIKRGRRDSAGYLFTAPSDGSCCKRWCMLLRWVGRVDEIDPGLWTKSSPLASTFPEGRALRANQLILPLDTHTGRISQYLGLTARKSLNWKAAVEITQRLKASDAADPTKYDFALSRLGILDLCQKRYRVEICSQCSLLPVCQLAQKKR